MEKKLKAKWVKALRSGRYKQTDSVLKSSDGAYCCLGVLCRVAGAELRYDEDNGTIATLNGEVISNAGNEVLSMKFLRRIGLTERRQQQLTKMNDGDNIASPAVEPRDFKEIAEYIEKRF